MSATQKPAENRGEMPFLDHIRELRSRFFWCLTGLTLAFIVSYLTYDSYISYIVEPFNAVLKELGHDPELVIRGLAEAFSTKMQFSFYAALVLSSPLHVYQVMAFIMPALTRKERTVLGAGLSAGTVLFVMGVSMAYFVVLPITLRFLLGTDLMPTGTKMQIDFSSNLLFVGKMILAFAVLFQLPLVLVILMAFDIVKRQTLLDIGRYMVVVIFIVAAILTPPDVISQTALAVPLVILYYLAIFVAKICGYGNPD